MPSFEEHCISCREKLGQEFTDVHLWLDEFHGRPPYGTRHRFIRHHCKGIEEVRRKWGDQAARAAEIHIRDDLRQEGWPDFHPLPADSDDYRRYGLW